MAPVAAIFAREVGSFAEPLKEVRTVEVRILIELDALRPVVRGEADRVGAKPRFAVGEECRQKLTAWAEHATYAGDATDDVVEGQMREHRLRQREIELAADSPE